MVRTKGSGWGAGTILYQLCPKCGKKKAIFDPLVGQAWYNPFRCISCKEHFNADNLLRFKYISEIKKLEN